MHGKEYVFTKFLGLREQKKTKRCKLSSMMEVLVDMAVEAQVDMAVVDTVIGVDMEDVAEDIVATAAATEATMVAALGVVLMLVRLFNLIQGVLNLLTKNHAYGCAPLFLYIWRISYDPLGYEVWVSSQIKGNKNI